MEFSYWERGSFLSGIDFIVVGAGIVGLNAALALRQAEPKARIVVLERGALPTGASSKNAGFACFGSASELLDDLATRDEQEVWALVAQRYDGLRQLRQLLGDANIGYMPSGNYEIFAPKDADLYASCVAKLWEFNAQMRDITGEKEVFKACAASEIRAQGFRPQAVAELIINRAEGQVNTGKLLRQLWKLALQNDIDVFCGVEVKNIAFDGKNAIIETVQLGRLCAPRLVVATNGFARQLLPDLEVSPARNQVLVTRPIANLALKGCFHYDKGYIYFRNLPDNRILLGGGRNLDIAGETTFDFGNTSQIMDYLQAFLRDTIALPNGSENIEIDYSWSGILGVGATKKPIIEKVNAATTVAVRLGGMGVAIGTAVGRAAAKLALKG